MSNVNRAFASRASRRGVIKGGAALGLGAMSLASLGSRMAAAQDAGSLEVFSWWTSPGEAPALQALFDAYSAAYPDVEIINAAVAGGAGVNAIAVLQTRLQGNQPPDSWQTHIGRELIDQYVVPGYCEPITDLYAAEGWADVMPEGLVEQATWEGEQYSIPVGVHRGNGFWYNRQVMADNGIEVGDTMSMDEFFAAADTLQAAGIPALALAMKDTFPGAQTFENTLLGVVGPDTYNALFRGEADWDEQGVRDAADAYARMLDYVNEDFSALTWDQAMALVIEGSAGFNSMGDWAYGEVVAKDAVDNIGWVSHPGTAGSFVLVVDSFTLPVGAPNAENARNWLTILGTVEAQEAFNPLKGSISPRTDVNRDIFSPYHQWSMDSFANDALVPSCAHGQASSPAFKQAFYDASVAFVTDKDVDTYVLMLQDAAAMDAEATA
ncbi:MAG: putative transporter substrate binding protein [Thermomicrobiales bacterium]|jgi:glucose/mannose transport system substrate-binding protein|nr:putative transporter substrate binding protein [Thermomicrobiales bacterium]MDF3038119.1 putative transporter substrate binding protein [Thermomicrobiales bacterium]